MLREGRLVAFDPAGLALAVLAFVAVAPRGRLLPKNRALFGLGLRQNLRLVLAAAAHAVVASEAVAIVFVAVAVAVAAVAAADSIHNCVLRLGQELCGC